jgi:hypothetical protein
MKPIARWRLPTLALLLVLGGCVTQQPYDYTNYRAHPPRSILVLPPLNESTAVEGTYSYLSTVTQPLAELGYYVFPVAVIDQYLKANGMPTAGEMHQIPLAKVAEIIGADAVLYVDLKQYGSKFQLVSSNAVVTVAAKLVDTRSATVLWEGSATAQSKLGGEFPGRTDCRRHYSDHQFKERHLARRMPAGQCAALLPGEARAAVRAL